MTSRSSYTSTDVNREHSRGSVHTHPRTFDFEDFPQEFNNLQTQSSIDSTGPNSPIHSRDPAVYVEEYTTTYTKIVRSTEHLDSIDNEPFPLPPNFTELERSGSGSYDFGSDNIGFGSDRVDLTSTNGSPPRRTKSLSSFQDIDDDDYGFIAIPYSKSPVPPQKTDKHERFSIPTGRGTTSGGKVSKSIERWESESQETNGNLYRSLSEKRLNGAPERSHKDVDIAALRAQSLRDLSNKYSPDASTVTVEYHQNSLLESTPRNGWDRMDGIDNTEVRLSNPFII